ncbi:MAG: DUF4097 family beta strand repeat-containing protein [Bacteroidota bacterium]
MKRLSGIVVVITVAAVVGLGADRKFEKKIEVTSGGTFRLNTDVGSVSIVGADTKEVSIVAEVSGARKDVNDFKIDAWKTDNGVEVRGESPRSNWGFNWGDLEVKYTVTVPHEYSMELNTSGGNVSLTSLKGRFRGETSGGDIRLKDLEGAATMETSGGNIGAESVTGDLALETSGGDISIRSVKGAVRVGTSGGNITVIGAEGKVHAETSGGSIVVRMPGSNQGVFAETSGGDIDIHVAENIGATVDASTSGGDVSCDLPITMQGKIDESRIRGNVNGGGATIHAHTSGGNVRIKTLE